MVDISSQEKKINIKVQLGSVQTNVGVTQDATQYYSEKSREYAEKAKLEASKATATKEQLDINYESYKNQLQTLTDNSKESINVLTEDSLTELQNKSASSQNEISSFVATSLEDFSSSASLITSDSKIDIQNSATVAKNTAISEIQAQEIESINNVQGEGINQVNSAKEQADIAKEQADLAKQQVQLAKDEVAKISNVYKFKGSVANFESLPNNASNGDVYDVLDTGVNYAWTGTEWDSLGGALNVDVSGVVHLAGAETITGAKTFTGAVNLIGSGDSNAVGVSTNTRFNVHNTGKTILGFGSGMFYINHGDYRLRLRGKDKRPHYNSDSNHLALLSDIPDTSNLATKTELEQKQDTLTAGENITIEDGIISATGGSGSGFSLFDIVQKDHVLSFEESKGLAMLGSYVYKNGVAGSRYGYADFYNKCLDEYKNSTEAKVYKSSNIIKYNNVVNRKGVLSGFTARDYAQINNTLNLGSNFEITVKFTTGESVTTSQTILGGEGTEYLAFGFEEANGVLHYNLGTGSSWLLNGDARLGSNKIQINTTYYVKLSFDGTKYSSKISTNNVDWLQDWSANKTNVIPSFTCLLGVSRYYSNPFLGSIDLNECYIDINGERWWSGAEYFNYSQNSSGHRFYDIANKADVDYLFEQTGEAMFYGVDEENERIFLPRRTRTQATMNPDEVNGFIEAGLPNVQGTVDATQTGAIPVWIGTADGYSGALSVDAAQKNYTPSAGSGGAIQRSVSDTLTLDASRSSEIYGNSDTVQPPASLVLEYMVVGNVNVEKAQTDVIEITTSENDTLPLFYNFYSEEDMTTTGAYVNASLGGYLSGNVYTTAYQGLVNKLGTGNVKSVTDTFTDYDFVVNQDNMTFRLPLLNGEEDLPGDSYELLTVPASGQAITVEKNGVYCFYSETTSSGQRVLIGNSVSSETYEVWSQSSNQALAASVFAKRGAIVKCIYTVPASKAQLRFSPAKGNGNLYYKVANALSNLAIMDVAKIEATKADKTAVDGQWVGTNIQLASGVSMAGTSDLVYDLSSYIPNDGYNYEVMLQGKVTTGSTSGNYGALYLKSSVMSETITVCIARTRSSSTMASGGTVNIPIGTDRLIYVTRESSFSANFNLDLKCIRRLGTNQ